MDIGLKRRLITAIIILALIVIFVPMLFKQHESSNAEHVVITAPAIPPSQPQVDQQQQPAEQPIEQQTAQQPTQPPMVQQQQVNVKRPNNQPSAMPIAKPTPKVTQTAIKVVKIKSKSKPLPIVLPHTVKYGFVPKPKLKPNAKAYVVRLGVFANDANATELIHNLRNKGFTSFGYKQKIKDNKILTHVYVGPLVTRKHAEQTVQQLKKIMNLKGIVTQFDATKLY